MKIEYVEYNPGYPSRMNRIGSSDGTTFLVQTDEETGKPYIFGEDNNDHPILLTWGIVEDNANSE